VLLLSVPLPCVMSHEMEAGGVGAAGIVVTDS
jgi:hypothetical protein